MKTNEITIEDIRNLENETMELIDAARKLTDKQLDLAIEIIRLIDGRPDRQQYAISYTGKMSELPALLAQI